MKMLSKVLFLLSITLFAMGCESLKHITFSETAQKASEINPQSFDENLIVAYANISMLRDWAILAGKGDEILSKLDYAKLQLDLVKETYINVGENIDQCFIEYQSSSNETVKLPCENRLDQVISIYMRYLAMRSSE